MDVDAPGKGLVGPLKLRRTVRLGRFEGASYRHTGAWRGRAAWGEELHQAGGTGSFRSGTSYLINAKGATRAGATADDLAFKE